MKINFKINNNTIIHKDFVTIDNKAKFNRYCRKVFNSIFNNAIDIDIKTDHFSTKRICWIDGYINDKVFFKGYFEDVKNDIAIVSNHRISNKLIMKQAMETNNFEYCITM